MPSSHVPARERPYPPPLPRMRHARAPARAFDFSRTHCLALWRPVRCPTCSPSPAWAWPRQVRRRAPALHRPRPADTLVPPCRPPSGHAARWCCARDASRQRGQPRPRWTCPTCLRRRRRRGWSPAGLSTRRWTATSSGPPSAGTRTAARRTRTRCESLLVAAAPQSHSPAPGRQVLRVDANGSTTLQDLKRRELLRSTGLPARDLRRIDPALTLTTSAPSLLVSDEVLLINLGQVRCVWARRLCSCPRRL